MAVLFRNSTGSGKISLLNSALDKYWYTWSQYDALTLLEFVPILGATSSKRRNSLPMMTWQTLSKVRSSFSVML